jgi:pyrroloquinoline-quinone synthase
MTYDIADSTGPADPRAGLAAAVASGLEGRMLLTHPFYRRWEAGQLRGEELAEYAVHYRAFEAVLPAVLSSVIDRLAADGQDAAAGLVARNLADELASPRAHLDLFDEFADALPDAAHAPRPSEGALALVETYRQLADESPAAVVAGLAAYETQASDIAATKGDGLRRWYGLDATGTAFWDVHATMDADHGDWAVEALAEMGAEPDEVADAARRAADAWWALLDEREAEGVTPVA